MEEVILDTDFIIDLLRGYTKRIESVITKIHKRQIKGCISQISVIELFAGEDSVVKELILSEFLSLLKIIPLDFELCKLAGSIKRKYHLSLADSVIAATSSQYKIRLFTFNTKHFSNLADVNLYSQTS